MTFGLGRRACTALAIAAYLVVALYAFRDVLSAPSTLLGYPSVIQAKHRFVTLDHRDQAMVVATVIRNANLLVTRPWDLFADVGQCYPMPNAYTLGEHMFGVGLLAALPYALTGDPILTYNVVLILTLWIPAITMYFLALRFTRRPGPAFVAGLAFALIQARLFDPSHPYVHGDLWAPAVLLFLHRLFVTGRTRDALGLALFLNLEVFESLYPLISTCLVAATYGVYLLFRHRENLGRVLPRLTLALALAGVGVWIVLVPYLATSAEWGLLSGRQSLLLMPPDFLPGGDYFPGFVVLFFVAVAMLDRLRGPRVVHREDPRIAFFVAGLVLIWSCLAPTGIPALGIVIESPFLTLRDVIPGLAAVRALSSVGIGLGIATSLLVGYGVLALTERLRPPPWAPVAGAVACALVLLTFRFVATPTRAAFGHTFRLVPYEARPSQENIDLLRRVGPGPRIDYPLGGREGGKHRLDVAEALLLGSYDPRPQGACYNSFLAPVNDQVVALSEQLPDPSAIRALGALGFETLLVDHRRAGQARLDEFQSTLRTDHEATALLEPIADAPRMDAYRIRAPERVTHRFDRLRPRDDEGRVEALMPRTSLEFTITNPTSETFAQPKPLRPSDLLVRWRNAAEEIVHEEPRRALLPAALGPGGSMSLALDLTTPSRPGTYSVSLVRRDDPEHHLAIRNVELPALEDVLSPAEIAMHLYRDYVNQELVPHGTEVIFPPDDDVEMLLGPGASSAAEIRAYGRLAAHWFNGFDSQSSTTTFEAKVEPTGLAGLIRVRMPIPLRSGLYTLLITPVDDPTTLLAGKMVFPDLETLRELGGTFTPPPPKQTRDP